MESKLSSAMAEKGISRQILGERVRNHVPRGAVNQDNFASNNTFTQGVHAKVNVL